MTTTKLLCPECRHENEAERIYCHDCGARLDRDGLLKEKPDEKASAQQAQRHLKKMFSPNRGRGKRIATQLFKVIVGAVCLAAVVVMLLPPDLPPAPKSYDFAPMINMDLVSALSSRQPPTLVYNEQQVNSYLAAAVRRKDSPAHAGFLPIQRLFVQLQEDQCWVHTERRIFQFSLYAGSAYRVTIGDGKIAAVSSAGYIGRMPIHPSLMRYSDIVFRQAWECVARERKSLAQLAALEFHPQSVTLIVTR